MTVRKSEFLFGLICRTVHREDILFSSSLFSRRFPRVCSRRESETRRWLGCGFTVDTKGLSWPRPTLLPNNRLFSSHPTHESRHPETPLPPRLQLRPRTSQSEQQGGGTRGSINTRCFMRWFFPGDFLLRILSGVTLTYRGLKE